MESKTKFGKNRFLIRLHAFAWAILETRDKDFDAEKMKGENLIVLVLKATNFASTEENKVMNELLDVIATKPDEKDELGDIRAALEGKIIIYDKLNPRLLLEERDIMKDQSNVDFPQNVSDYTEKQCKEYLELYPNGSEAEHVKERLKQLSALNEPESKNMNNASSLNSSDNPDTKEEKWSIKGILTFVGAVVVGLGVLELLILWSDWLQDTFPIWFAIISIVSTVVGIWKHFSKD